MHIQKIIRKKIQIPRPLNSEPSHQYQETIRDVSEWLREGNNSTPENPLPPRPRKYKNNYAFLLTYGKACCIITLLDKKRNYFAFRRCFYGPKQ